jgi:hypothetical protein
MSHSLRMLALLAVLAGASCVVAPVPPSRSFASQSGWSGDPVFVNEPPPPPRRELIVGSPPRGSYAWVDGYWARRPSGWVWVGGRWAHRPRPGARWRPGRWDRSPRGYFWVSGGWRW